MPADVIDVAQEFTEKALERSLSNLPQTHIPFSGACLHCEEPVEERRFCDKHCREAYEKSAVRRARN